MRDIRFAAGPPLHFAATFTDGTVADFWAHGHGKVGDHIVFEIFVDFRGNPSPAVEILEGQTTAVNRVRIATARLPAALIQSVEQIEH